MSRFRVLGAGVWGLAFANHLLDCGNNVEIYCRNPKKSSNLKNSLFIDSDAKVSEKIIQPLSELQNNSDSNIVNIIASNSIGFSDLINTFPDYLSNLDRLVWLTKGLDHQSGCLFSQIVENKFNIAELALISGPSFAEDLINKKSINVSLAANSNDLSDLLLENIQTPFFKLLPINDIQVIEYSGIIKNIAAILCGMSDKYYGISKHTDEIINKAKTDITNFRQTYVNDDTQVPEILNSPGCDGDLNLTCRSNTSRNYRFGEMLADSNFKIEEAIKEIETVEGYDCCISLKEQSNLCNGVIVTTAYEIIKNDNRKQILSAFLNI